MQQPQFSNQTQAELCVNVPYYELVGGCVKEECSVVDSLREFTALCRWRLTGASPTGANMRLSVSQLHQDSVRAAGGGSPP